MEEQEKKELEKDINAITRLAADCRSVGMGLNEWSVPHVAEMHKQLQHHTVVLKQLQEDLDGRIFNGELGAQPGTVSRATGPTAWQC